MEYVGIGVIVTVCALFVGALGLFVYRFVKSIGQNNTDKASQKSLEEFKTLKYEDEIIINWPGIDKEAIFLGVGNDNKKMSVKTFKDGMLYNNFRILPKTAFKTKA